MIAYELIEKENKALQSDKKNKINAAVLTLLVALGIFLFAFLIPLFFAPNPPLTSFTGGGSEIILGSTDYGMGETYELVSAGEPEVSSSQNDPEPSPSENSNDILVSEEKSDEDFALKVEKNNKDEKKIEAKINKTKENTTENKVNAKNEEKSNEPIVDKNILFKKSDKKGNGGTGGGNNTSKGTGDKAGDQGSKTGNPNSKSFEGDGKGKGFGGGIGDGIGLGGELKGRDMLKRPKNTSIQVKGKIEFNISVDQNGNVLSVSLADKNIISLTGNANDANNVIAFFTNELKNSKFNAGDYASGTITIILDPK